MGAVYAIVFIAVGLILLLLELKFVPGLGALGVAAVALIVYGSYLAIHNYDMLTAATIIGGATVLSGVLLLLLVRSRLTRRLVLEARQVGQPSGLPEQRESLVGKVGEAVSDLRPAGIARLDGRRVDVVAAEGEYIDAGDGVRVVRIHQNSVIVTRQPR